MCVECGLVVHAQVPSQAEQADYYARRYRREYHGSARPAPRRVVRAWRAGGARARRLAPLFPGGALAFEVGAGLGGTLKQLELLGLEASGIEPDPVWAAFAREELRVDVRDGRLEELNQAAYDLVLLVHVIEHLPSPRRALERVRGLVGEGGRVYVECPNLNAPFARPGKLFHPAHIHNFTPATLVALAARAGLALERSFTGPRNPTTALLFRPAEPEETALDSANRERTRAVLGASGLRYYLRPEYLSLRATKLSEQMREALFAAAECRRILRRCRECP